MRKESNKEEEKVSCLLLASMAIIGLPQMQHKTRHSIAECTSLPCMTSCLSSGFCGRNRVSQRWAQGPWAPRLWASAAWSPFRAANTHTHIYWWPQQRVLRAKWAGMLNQLCILGKDSSSSSISQFLIYALQFFSLNKRCQIYTRTWHPLYIRQELYKFPYRYVTTPTQSWY